MNEALKGYAERGVAIIGMGVRVPGAATVDQYWSNLVNRVDSITTMSKDELDPTIPDELRNRSNYIPCRGLLEDVDKFDNTFFGLTPLEAMVMDPQHRIFLQLVWSALEDAGVVPDTFDGLIGVYGGSSPNTYFAHHVSPRKDVMRRIGDYAANILSDKDFLATRTSYALDLKGPSIAINTACSTALVAVSEAFQHLMTFQCDVAVAGGVSVFFPQRAGYLWQEGSNFSRQGRCRPFDENSDGMLVGGGGGVVVLKRLEEAIEDKDRIYAVIRGAALNNDGAQKIGFSAPSIRGQRDVISFAQAEAEVEPETIGYIETHGTATRIGDQIEVEALKQVFRKCPEHSIVLGAVKSNIGHLDAGAGAAGLIKAALALKHKQIPPTVHFQKFNPELSMDDSPFKINTDVIDFAHGDTPRRAGVTGLGLGGTNAHIILEEPPPVEAGEKVVRHSRLLSLSAKNMSALARAHHNLADFIDRNPDVNLDDVAYTLAKGRAEFAEKNVILSTDAGTTVRRLKDAAKSLEKAKNNRAQLRKTVFVFPGQGVQYAGMGATLYEVEPVFKETVDYCAQYLTPVIGFDIREVLFCKGEGEEEANETLRQTANTQPAIFVIEYAMAKLWQQYGVQPDAMIGHSIGQYAAACLSGVFSLDDCLKLVAARGRVIQAMEPGIMLSVPMSAEKLEKKLAGKVSIASVNAPELCVASGPALAIDALQRELQDEGVSCRVLRTSHAFHSDMMTGATAEFEQIAKDVPMNAPTIPFVCTATGTWITDEQAKSTKHWAEQIRGAVLFSPGVQTLLSDEHRIFVEVGPRNTMSTLIRRHLPDRETHAVVSSMNLPEHNESDVFGEALGQVRRFGGTVDILSQIDEESGEIISLPTYAFDTKSHWVAAVRSSFQGGESEAASVSASMDSVDSHEDESAASGDTSFTPVQRFLVRLWEDLLGASDVQLDDDFFDLGGHSLVGVQLLDKIRDRYEVDLLLSDFLRGSTLKQMADEIESRIKDRGDEGDGIPAPTRDWTPLVALNPRGSHAPIYCVAGVGGHVMELKQLADEFDDIPFYGLETRGVVEGHKPHETIEALATEHIEAIRVIQPEGPYYLCGYSIGGIVAFEMAKQLKAQNEEIAWLGLIDTGSPILPRRSRLDFRRVQLKRFLKDPTGYVQQAIARRQRELTRKPGARYAHVYLTMCEARERYTSKSYKGDAVLFRTRKSEYIDDFTWAIDDYNGWRPLIAGRLDVIPVLGRHLTVVQEPQNAKFLAKRMQESILGKTAI